MTKKILSTFGILLITFYSSVWANEWIISGAPTSGGGGVSDIVDDESPQLGGNLDVNGKEII